MQGMRLETKTNDMRSGWVQRWFAKPLAKGSIPSHVSRYSIGRKIGRFLIKRGSPLQSAIFSGIYQEFCSHFSGIHQHVEPDAARWKEIAEQRRLELVAAGEWRKKLIQASKELSTLKRGAK